MTDELGYTSSDMVDRKRYIVVYDRLQKDYPYRILDNDKCVVVTGTAMYKDARRIASEYNERNSGEV